MASPQSIVLVGGGHAHIGLLRAWATRRLTGHSALLVTPDDKAIYSGMLPGWVAGAYSLEDCIIDLRPLAGRAGAALLVDRVIELDADRKGLTTAGGVMIGFDNLSLATGGRNDCSFLAELGDRLLPLRPVPEFVSRWTQFRSAARSSEVRLAIVGGGAAGLEMAFAADVSLRQFGRGGTITLVASREGLLAGHGACAVRHARLECARRGIELIEQDAAGSPGGLLLSDGRYVAADFVIAATPARPPDWLRLSGLALHGGHVLVDAAQRSRSHPFIFASGDAAQRCDRELPHSGVHALKAGKVMAHNILAPALGQRLKKYRPRRRTLALIALGDRRAILSWGRWSLRGEWPWRLKDWIDRRFVARG